MIGEIISIGDELLIGQVVNTNASWIAHKLNDIGIRITQVTTVPDAYDRITEALTEASQRADVIIMTGGLGPTKDDMTKQTLCDYFNTRLIYNAHIFQNIVDLFGGRGLTWNKLNKLQAFVPESCTVLPNKHGTAAGMWFEKDETLFISLPGVPFEMKSLISETVIPKIIASYPNLGAVVHRTVYTQGIPESVLATRIEDWEIKLPKNIKLAYLPRPGMVRLRLSAFGDSKEELQKAIENELSKLNLIMPGEIFGSGEESLEAIIGNLLVSRNNTLSIAESCTGGYISHLITSVPGSSAYFKGATIAYSNEIKEGQLGVDVDLLIKYGAVSEVVVKAMATGIKTQMATDYAVATSGVAGPGGGTEEKPVGTTWIAISTPEKVIARKFQFGEHRERNIQRATFTALNMLRKELKS